MSVSEVKSTTSAPSRPSPKRESAPPKATQSAPRARGDRVQVSKQARQSSKGEGKVSPLLRGLQDNYGQGAVGAGLAAAHPSQAQVHGAAEGGLKANQSTGVSQVGGGAGVPKSQDLSPNGVPRAIATSTLLGAAQAEKFRTGTVPGWLKTPLAAGNILGGLNAGEKAAQTVEDFKAGRKVEGVLNGANTVATVTAAAGNAASLVKKLAPAFARVNPLSSAALFLTEGAHQAYSGKTLGEKALGAGKLLAGVAVGYGVLGAAPLLASVGALTYAGTLAYEHSGKLLSWLRGS